MQTCDVAQANQHPAVRAKQRWRRGLIPGALLICGSFPAAAATNFVPIQGFSFNPKVVNINGGDMIVWTNAAFSHTVTGSGAEALCGGGAVGFIA